MCEANIGITGTKFVGEYDKIAQGEVPGKLLERGAGVIALRDVMVVPESSITQDPFVAAAVLQEALRNGLVRIEREA